MTGIGESAFKKCNALKSIEIPAGVTVIDTDTFSGCTDLESIILHDSLKQVRSGAFSSCTSLKSVQLPKYLEKLEDSAFNVSGLTSVTVPGNLTQIEKNAFQNCTGLTTVELEEGVIGIGGWAFSGCSALSSVSLPNSLKDIEKYAFNICPSIQSLKLPEKLEKIGDYAFNKCESLKDITIPESVTEIGSRAFELCRDLKSFTVLNPEVILPEDTGKNEKTPFISNRAYNDKNIFEGTLYGYKGSTLETYAKNHELNFEEIQTVPTSGELSETLSWKYNPARHELVITGEGEIPDFEKMEDVPWYTYRDDIFFISLPDGLTAIGDYAFWGCRIHHIDLPAVLTRLGKYSFASNSNLESLVLPSSLKTLGDSALSVCTKLKAIDIPENLNEISEGAFMLSGLETITLPEHVTSIGKLSFAWCPYLTDVFILNPECTINMDMSTISSQLFASGDPKKQFSGTIHGYMGSTAANFAETNHCSFQTLEFSVHFDANGGTGTVPEDSHCTLLEFPQNTLTGPHGMEFMGWRVNDKVYQPGDSLRLTDNVTVYAEWGYSVCIVSFELNGGNGELPPIRLFKYSNYEMPSCTVTPPEGQCFAGWGIKTVDDKILMPGDIYSVEANTVFYPIWKPLEYTVVFNANGGTGEMPDKVLKPNAEFTLPKCGFTPKEGYVFEGWKISGSEDETVYQPGDTVIVKENIEFTALWKKQPAMLQIGDVNNDGTVDTLDAALLAKFVNGWNDVTVNAKTADINQDGTISVVDAMILTRYVNGWDGYDSYIIKIEDKDI